VETATVVACSLNVALAAQAFYPVSSRGYMRAVGDAWRQVAEVAAYAAAARRSGPRGDPAAACRRAASPRLAIPVATHRRSICWSLRSEGR